MLDSFKKLNFIFAAIRQRNYNKFLKIIRQDGSEESREFWRKARKMWAGVEANREGAAEEMVREIMRFGLVGPRLKFRAEILRQSREGLREKFCLS